jgi:hypothetical protein
MIPASGTQIAMIQTADGRYRRAVHAWDDDGHPMVVGTTGLVRADSLGDVDKILDGGDEFFRIVAAVPGGGWMMRDTDQQPMRSVPVISWLVRADGTTTAVVPEGQGDSVNGHELVAHPSWTFHHPDTTTDS